jgi:peptidyl-prolyl cis-trans isomerase B (cyclophilin B)
MARRRTRDRQLNKLAARRAAERRKKHRQRIVAATVAIIVAVAGIGYGVYVLVHSTTSKAKPSASGATPTSSASASATPASVACGGTVPAAAGKKKTLYKKAPALTINKSKTYTATIETSCGTIVVKLDPKGAPNTVNSVVFLAQHHFYDGLIFHRVVPNFVIQGGDPQGTGSGGPGYSTVDAPPKGAKYTAGVVAMAKGQTEAAGTAGSQFFIVTGADVGLPAEYAMIGNVTTGQDVADKIDALPIQEGASDGPPTETVYIVKITIAVS